jgi:hypothetical protein
MRTLPFKIVFITWHCCHWSLSWQVGRAATEINLFHTTYASSSLDNQIHSCWRGADFRHMRVLRGGGRFGIIDDDSGDMGPFVPDLRQPNISKSLNARLRHAAQDGNLTAVQDLVAQGARVNAVERTTHACALITSSFQNDRDMVRLLLRLGAKTDLQDEMMMTALHYAAGWGYEEMTEILMGAGADPFIGNMVCNLFYEFKLLLDSP